MLTLQPCVHVDAESKAQRRTSANSLGDAGNAACARDLSVIHVLDPEELAGPREAGRVMRQRSTRPQWLGSPGVCVVSILAY